MMASQKENAPKVGYQTIIWGPQIDDLEGVLDVIANAGYQGVEFAQRLDKLRRREDPRIELDIHDLCRLLEEKGLTLLSFAAGTLEERVRSCDGIRPEYLYVEDWDPRYASIAVAEGFTLALHPHVFKVVHRLTDAMALLKDHPELQFLPDTAHLTIAGDSPAEAIRKICDDSLIGKERLIGVHLKDWTPGFGRSSHRYAQGFTELGEGVVRLEAVLDELAKIEFGGWLIVEQDATKEDPQASILKCANWLAKRKWIVKTPMKFKREVERTRGPRIDQKRCDPKAEMLFIRSVFSASGEPIETCYQHIVNAFMDLIPCKLATLWACNQANDFMSLQAISPNNVSLPSYVYKYRDALSTVAIERATVIRFDLRSPSTYSGRDYQPAELITQLGLTYMVSIPIFNPANHNHMPLLLNLFPTDEELPVSYDELFWFGVDVGRSVDIAIDELCLDAAGRASLLAGQSQSSADMLLGLRTLLQDHLYSPEIAIFLVNYSGNKLELAETSGTQWQVPEKQQYYSRGEGITGVVWERNAPLLTDNEIQELGWIGKSIDTLTPEADRGEIIHDSCMIAPLMDAKGEVVGVVRCYDKRTSDTRVFNMFSDDDVAVLDAVSQATVPYLQVRRAEERYRRAVGRVTHELKTFLVEIKGGAAISFFHIVFRDWGPGIDKSLQNSVFDEGVRAPDAIQSNVAGQGLGLWVVRQVVEAHGGEVELTRCNQPTEITIRLPKSLQFYHPSPSTGSS